MAVTLKNASGSQYGTEANEPSVEVMSFEVRYFPEYKEPFLSHLNQTTGFAVPDKLSQEITLDANVKGATGPIMAATHTTAITFANDVNTFQTSPGGAYMDEITEKQSYNGWRSVSLKATAHPECA